MTSRVHIWLRGLAKYAIDVVLLAEKSICIRLAGCDWQVGKSDMKFIGRTTELAQIHAACKTGEASLIVVYGRRRVGKTTLIEKAISETRVLKFEGIEGKPEVYQVDLLYQRADKVFTVCEIKYQDAPVGVEAIEDVEKKIQSLPIIPSRSLTRSRPVQKVLISSSGASKGLIERAYFDRILSLEDLLDYSL